jgi:hypothetical protein
MASRYDVSGPLSRDDLVRNGGKAAGLVRMAATPPG